LVVDGKVKVYFLTFDFRLGFGFVVVEVKVRLLGVLLKREDIFYGLTT